MPQKSFTVYVVDDDASIQTALKRLLRSLGYHAFTFDSAEDFLEAIANPDGGCLVLDLRLPGMTGLDLQEKLASSGLKCSVIFMTAYDNPELRARANKAGAIAFLKKPFHEQSLLDAIKLASTEGR